MLIDDDDDELEIFTSALDDLQVAYNCIFARNAEQAMRILNNSTPDLIFLDINMPGRNGMQCLNDIKKMKSLEKVPVIMYSTSPDGRAGDKAMAFGAAAYIRKPSSLSSLSQILKQVFDSFSVLDPYPIFQVYA